MAILPTTLVPWMLLVSPLAPSASPPEPRTAHVNETISPHVVLRGATVEGSPFALRVEGLKPGARGVLEIGVNQAQPSGWRSSELLIERRWTIAEAFVADARGRSPWMFELPSVGSELVGLSLSARIHSGPRGSGSSPVEQFTIASPIGGSMFPRPAYLLGAPASSASLVDVNGDGLMDMAAAGGSPGVPGTLAVRLQRPDGSFGQKRLFTVGEQPDAVLSGDVNADGAEDLVVFAIHSDGYSVLLGDGRGGFTTLPIASTGDRPTDAAIGDMDGDGALDLVVTNYDDKDLSVLFGAGDGTFPVRVDYPINQWPREVRLAALDGQPGLDVLLLTSSPEGLSVFSNDGAGALSFASRNELAAGNPVHSGFTTGDWNQDGRVDALVGRDGGQALRSFLGNGDGTLTEIASTPLPSRPRAIATGPLDGDGFPDLVVVSQVDESAMLLRGAGDGTFSLLADMYVKNMPNGVDLAEMNDDGIADALVVSRGVGVFLMSRGDFVYDRAVRLEPQTTLPFALATGDLDGNGLKDLAVADRDRGSVSVFLGQGRGTFAAETQWPSGHTPYDLALRDLDADGALDLVSSGLGPTTSAVHVQWGVGDGTFSMPSAFPMGSFPQALAVADLDGDGALDLATACFSDDGLAVALASSPRSFAAPVIYPSVKKPSAIAAGRLDGDSAVDLVCLSNDRGKVSVLLNTGQGQFGPSVDTLLTRQPKSIALGDLDEDGDLDLVITTTNSVLVMLGAGDGSFGPPAAFSPGGGPRDLALADLDGDGHLDAAVGMSGPWGMAVFLGRGDGTLGAPAHYTGEMGWTLAIDDMDGDRLPDVVTSWYDVSVFLNRRLRGTSVGSQPMGAESAVR